MRVTAWKETTANVPTRFLEYEYQNTRRSSTYKNELEGGYTRFSTSFLHFYANIWKFIEKLKQDLSLNHLKMAHEITGAPNPPQCQIYWVINEGLQTLVDGYGQSNLIDFFREISHNLAR